MPENTESPTLEQLEEKVRERLVAHGQHGALAEFAKYTAAVGERLGSGLREKLVEVYSQLKPSDQLDAEAAPLIEELRALKPKKGKAK